MVNISLVTRTIQKLDLSTHSFKKWVYIKDNLIRLTKRMYFMIKDTKSFGKYVTICGKVGNIIKET